MICVKLFHCLGRKTSPVCRTFRRLNRAIIMKLENRAKFDPRLRLTRSSVAVLLLWRWLRRTTDPGEPRLSVCAFQPLVNR